MSTLLVDGNNDLVLTITKALAVHDLGSYLKKLGEFFISILQDNLRMLLQRAFLQQDGATPQLVRTMNRTCPE
jgi:hypothetical protein